MIFKDKNTDCILLAFNNSQWHSFVTAPVVIELHEHSNRELCLKITELSFNWSSIRHGCRISCQPSANYRLNIRHVSKLYCHKRELTASCAFQLSSWLLAQIPQILFMSFQWSHLNWYLHKRQKTSLILKCYDSK